MLAASLVPGPAFALGLGQIEVKSQRGQPLLAEIPIVSSDPSELENLQARLASPDTFARIGLEPPQGIVSGLQFSVALGPRGDPVIRVTSQQPVDQALLTFLLEVDWGQGRLVREYSVLVDAPRTVAAPAQPPIEAPTLAPSNTIVREPEPAPAAAVAEPPAPPAESTAAGPAPIADETPEEPAQPDNAIAIPAPVAPPAPPAPRPPAQPVAAAPAPAASGPITVQAGDTLGAIARSLDRDGHTLDQTMLALLRANPEAFIHGNINLVKRGAVLRLPQSDELSQYSAAEARAIVHQQIGQWREMRTPAPQPAAIAGADAASEDAKPASGNTTGARVADARLEIVPPTSSDGRQAGTRSGIDAGGEGDMLRQQELQQTRETLAARDAEVQELKSRVADLEKIQQEQQQLIALKDSKLAQAQQNLATSNAQTASSAQASPTGTPPPGQVLLWPWLIAALVVALLLAWLFMRRRQPAKPARPLFDTSAMAASIPARSAAGIAGRGPGASDADADIETEVEAEAATAGDDGSGASPPPWHSAGGTAADAAGSLNPAPAGHERLELARAYLDLGDVDTARSLLQEVADGGDAAARGEAARLLRDLV